MFQVVGAQAINPFTVRVTVSAALDFSVTGTVDPASYSIPGLSVVRVVSDPDPNSVRLITSPHVYQLYTVTVGPNVETSGAENVDPSDDEASFTGFSEHPRFHLKANRANAVTVLFVHSMTVDSALVDPASYVVTNPQGAPVTVTEVVPNDPGNPDHVLLKLGSNLAPGIPYAVTISPSVRTSSGLALIPDQGIVQWVVPTRTLKIPLRNFTGEVKAPKGQKTSLSETLLIQESVAVGVEVLRYGPEGVLALHERIAVEEGLSVQGGFSPNPSLAVTVSELVQTAESSTFTRNPDFRAPHEYSFAEGLSLRESLTVLPVVESQPLDPDVAKLFGNPDGLVFFSPSLSGDASPNSAVQVDEVTTCTRAFDSYSFPKTIDPKPLYTYGAGVVPTPEITTLNSAVLFTNFYRLNEAQTNLTDRRMEVVDPPVDESVTIVLKEIYPPARVALLNNPAWVTVDGPAANPPYYFRTVDLLSGPLPAPSVGPMAHFVNTSEILGLVENIEALQGVGVAVADTVVASELFDLAPGESVVQVNVSETLTGAEGLTTQLGIHLSETMTLGETLSLSF